MHNAFKLVNPTWHVQDSGEHHPGGATSIGLTETGLNCLFELNEVL
jgi:hypothetical protein